MRHLIWYIVTAVISGFFGLFLGALLCAAGRGADAEGEDEA